MEPSKTGTDVYRSRNPRASDYFPSVEAHFEELEGVWDDRYANRYGFWRPYTLDVLGSVRGFIEKGASTDAYLESAIGCFE